MLDWMRRRRNGLFVALVFLLLAMQQELALHPFEHLRGQLADTHQTALHQVGDPCDECALLSGVAHSLVVSRVPPRGSARGRSPFLLPESRTALRPLTDAAIARIAAMLIHFSEE